MSRRASNCFSLGEVQALLGVCSSADMRDTDRAQHYAGTSAAVRARAKLLRMRDRLAEEHPEILAEIEEELAYEIEVEPPRPPAKRYRRTRAA